MFLYLSWLNVLKSLAVRSNPGTHGLARKLSSVILNSKKKTKRLLWCWVKTLDSLKHTNKPSCGTDGAHTDCSTSQTMAQMRVKNPKGKRAKGLKRKQKFKSRQNHTEENQTRKKPNRVRNRDYFCFLKLLYRLRKSSLLVKSVFYFLAIRQILTRGEGTGSSSTY